MSTKSTNLSTEPYKGVRDFYPEDQFVQEHIFAVWKKAVEKFGYVSYNASVLEPTELYKAKSGQEIVNEQTYTFIDRGDREVSLRPEMTPTVARLVAGRRRELGYPLRLYSIPNLFRYERPQRGRLREHWQLNVDMFGLSHVQGDIELIELASEIMKLFGAKETDFIIKVSSRKLLNALFSDWYELDDTQSHAMKKLLDKKAKIAEDIFYSEAEQIIGKPFTFLNLGLENPTTTAGTDTGASNAPIHNGELSQALAFPQIKAAYDELKNTLDVLRSRGIMNVEFDPGIVRGFDYYTGMVFEVFDTDPTNNRSLFGGGRYDELMNLFGDESMPACGFGMGDVTIRDFLETRGLLPAYRPATDIMICVMDEASLPFANTVAQNMRSEEINIALNYSFRSVGDQIRTAEKMHIPFCIVIGQTEAALEAYNIKRLSTQEVIPVPNIEFVKQIIRRV